MSDLTSFSHAATVLPVKDLLASIDFYTIKLGFALTFSWGEPLDYAVLKRGGVGIHLTRRQDDILPSERHTALYIFVENVDAVFAEFKATGVADPIPPEDRDYAMRDFDIVDLDGYKITFGSG